MKGNIGVDARTIFSAQRRGIGRASLEMYKNLIRIMPEYNFFFYYHPGNVENPLPDSLNVHLRPIDIKGSRWNLWEEIRLPLAVLKDRIDLLHCPAQTSPGWKPVSTIVTIHDLIPLKMNNGFSQRYLSRFSRNINNSLRKAKHIITVSNFSKQEILNLSHSTNGNISVIPWANFKKFDSIDKNIAQKHLAANYRLTKPYFFTFGSKAPRKNFARLLKAFSKFKTENKNNIKLVVSGISESNFVLFQPLVESLGLKDDIINLGFLPEKEIAYFLKAAVGLAYVSLYEGFGLPILEGFSCGCPVITSDATSMPEIAGKGALLVNPRDINQIARAMQKVYQDANFREELIAAGKRRLADFSWDKSAWQVSEIFQSVLNS